MFHSSTIMLLFFLFFFFFQAEDGIRDRTVTGVQTCALPIFVALDLAHEDNRWALLFGLVAGAERAAIHTGVNDGHGLAIQRSEERRVGKECRSGGGRDQ